MKCFSIVCMVLFLLASELSATAQDSGSTTRPRSSVSQETAAKNQEAVQQALTLEQQGKFPEAEAAWLAVVKVQPRNALGFAHLGLLEARQEHYSEAIAHYRKAKALNPAIPQLNLNLGLALFKNGEFAEAAALFERELKTHSQHADDAANTEARRLTILAGMSHYGAHAYAMAIPYLKEAVAADQRNLPLRLTLAHCYLWTKQFDEALAVYKEILAIDPDSAEADMIAGEALDEKGDSDGAVQQFRAAERANPKEPNVHFGLAYLLWEKKRYDEAIPEFKSELENDPRNSQAMIYLGDTYIQQNQFDQAKAVLEAVGESQSRVALLHLDLGIVYAETGDKDAAIRDAAKREFSKAISLDPDNVNAHFRLAKLYQSQGRREEAKAEFAKASSINKKADDGLYKRIAETSAKPDADAKTTRQESSAPNRQ